MSNKTNSNSHAFARPWSQIKQSPDSPVQTTVAQKGLTKREYFAAHALQGLLSGGFNIHEDAGKIAVQFADDTLKALENEG